MSPESAMALAFRHTDTLPRRVSADRGLPWCCCPPTRSTRRAPKGRVRPQQMGSLPAPRLAAILQPLAPLTRTALFEQSEATASGLPPKACGSRTPEARSRYSCRRQQAYPCRSAGFLRRRDPHPEIQTVCSSRPHGRGMSGSLMQRRGAGISGAQFMPTHEGRNQERLPLCLASRYPPQKVRD
jgi:hypothetical protein